MEEIRRVLIVEDREDHQKFLREIVEGIGYKPEVAATVKESKAKLGRMSFHVALVDLSLDDKDPNNRDGFDVLAHIKAVDEGTMAIVLTAFGGVPDADKTFTEYGLSGFIEKPSMDVTEVGQRIRKAAEQAEQYMSSPKKLQRVMRLIKGEAVFQLLKEMRVTPEEGVHSIRERIRLEGFLSRLLGKEVRPLLPDKQDAIVHQPKGMSVSVKARFWSKALGKPIVAWFGRFDEMKTAVQAMDKSAESREEAGYGEKVNEVFDERNFPRLGGAVFSLADAAFDEFEMSNL